MASMRMSYLYPDDCTDVHAAARLLIDVCGHYEQQATSSTVLTSCQQQVKSMHASGNGKLTDTTDSPLSQPAAW